MVPLSRRLEKVITNRGCQLSSQSGMGGKNGWGWSDNRKRGRKRQGRRRAARWKPAGEKGDRRRGCETEQEKSGLGKEVSEGVKGKKGREKAAGCQAPRLHGAAHRGLEGLVGSGGPPNSHSPTAPHR